jgi:uncharacterized protein YwgA
MDDYSISEKAILALLYSKGKNDKIAEPIYGKTVLVKLLFLLWKNKVTTKRFTDFSFEPYNYGPYDDRVDLSLDELSLRNLVSIGSGKTPSIKLTQNGLSVAKSVWETLTKEEQAVVYDLKKTFGSMSVTTLLKYIYAAYPEYATESKLLKNYAL